MKKILFLIAVILTTNISQGATYKFNRVGNIRANEILTNYLVEEMPDYQGVVTSYFYDLDDDFRAEIIGIARNNKFYSVAGYKLITLKQNKGNWIPIKNDIYFDSSKDLKIENGKITYFKSSFFNNKKYKAKIGKKKIKTSKNIFDIMKERKAQKIADTIELTPAAAKIEYDLEELNPKPQKTINIYYTNLDERTKHYLDLK